MAYSKCPSVPPGSFPAGSPVRSLQTDQGRVRYEHAGLQTYLAASGKNAFEVHSLPKPS